MFQTTGMIVQNKNSKLNSYSIFLIHLNWTEQKIASKIAYFQTHFLGKLLAPLKVGH